MPRQNARPGDDDVALCQGLPLGEGVPDWVHLVPAGKLATVDGRGPYTLDDTAAVIANSVKASPDGKLVIDINHATDLAGAKGGPAPAQGWIIELQSRSDGLWGRVEWTEAGKAVLADRAYRFLSPVITAAKASGKIVTLLRASLTNNPNLRGLTPVLNTPDTETGMDFLTQLLTALGLPGTATEQTALAAIATLRTEHSAHAANLARIAKAAKAADGADAETVLNAVTLLADPALMVPAAQVKALMTELAEVKTGIARDKAERFVDAAIAAGKPGVKPLRDHFIARHMADATAVETELNAQISLHSDGRPKVPPPANGQVALDDADSAVVRLMGLDPEAYRKTKTALNQTQEAL